MYWVRQSLCTRARTERVVELLDTLVSLGQSRVLDDGRYVA